MTQVSSKWEDESQVNWNEKDRRWWDTFKGDQKSLEVKKQW